MFRPMPQESERAERRVAVVVEHVRLENEHDFAACLALFGEPRYEIVPIEEVHNGADAVTGFLRESQRGFPDFHFHAERVEAGGDVVFVEGTYTGTHEGTWNGLPATGRKVSFPMAVVFVFAGDTLVCERVYFDLGTPLRQLGVGRDPLTPLGRVLTALNHPVTITRALLRSLVRSLRPGRRRADRTGQG